MNIDISKLFEKEKGSLLLILLGVGLLLIAAIGGLPFGTQPTLNMEATWRYTLAGIGGVLLLVGLVLTIIGQGHSVSQKQVEDKVTGEAEHSVSRKQGEDKTTGEADSILFLEDFPSQFKTDFDSAAELWLIGLKLRNMIDHNYVNLEKRLRRGDHIRVLLVHPEGAPIEMAASRFCRKDNQKPEVHASDIVSTLHAFCDLKKISPEKLEIRTIKNPLTFGATAINPLSNSGILYLEHYPFRVESEAIPKFVLTSSNRKWYERFLKEIQALWDYGNEWECDTKSE